jgi:hypothetical protein
MGVPLGSALNGGYYTPYFRMRVRERAVAGSRLRSAAVRRNPTLVGNGVLFFEFEVPALVRRDDLRAW